MKIRIEILVDDSLLVQSMEEAIAGIFRELTAPILGIHASLVEEPKDEEDDNAQV